MWLWIEGTVTFVEEGPASLAGALKAAKGLIEKFDRAAIEAEALERVGNGNQSVVSNAVDVILEALDHAAAEFSSTSEVRREPDDGTSAHYP